jgi:ATP-dependent DNA helicase 2 subunit 1
LILSELTKSFIFLQLDETKTLMAMDGAAGLKLLAFRDRSELRWHHFVRHCHFIYPDENSVKGSRSLFAALLVKKKSFIC